jgi:predicted aspartyl protease
MATVTYSSSKRYKGNKPWADVSLNPSGPAVVTLKCLVDTGADYLQINLADANAAGISLAGATPTPVSSATGRATLQLLTGISVSIEGSRTLSIDLLVDMTNSTSPPLAGRTVLLAAFDLGFDVSQWLST